MTTRRHSASQRKRRGKYGFNGQRRQKIYGALDLGTNNCRLLIARPNSPGFQVAASFSRVVRLGEGLASSGRLSDTAMSRTIDALSVCAERLRENKVSVTRNIATEACRQADNGDDFLARIKRETGLEFETISCQEEARLAITGCQCLLDENAPYALVFDIGGGSTELIWSKRGQRGSYEIADVLSLPFGVVNLAEHCGTDVIDQNCYEMMVCDIAKQLSVFCVSNSINTRVQDGLVQMLGTSGTVTTLGAMHLNLPYYSRSRIDGLELKFEDISAASRQLTDLDYEGRAALPCIGRERAELVIPGCAILDAICRAWPVGKLRVADRGLREGMLLELMMADGLPVSGNPPAIEMMRGVPQ